jgi:hypothetical protein
MIVIKEFIENSYNGIYNDYYIFIFYKFIYLYSKIQIEIKKYNKKVYSITSTIVNLLKKCNIIVKPKDFIELYNDGKCIFKNEINYINSMIKSLDIKYELCICSFYKDSNIDKVCYDYKDVIEYDYKDVIEGIVEYTISKIKFITLFVIYQDTQYYIELMTDKYNFYIVNNKINQIFIKYYLINILNVSVKETVFEYILCGCDQNADVFTLIQEDIIVIELDSYRIYKSK